MNKCVYLLSLCKDKKLKHRSLRNTKFLNVMIPSMLACVKKYAGMIYELR